LGFLELDRRIRVVVTANFVAVAARMSVVTFLGIYRLRVHAQGCFRFMRTF